MTPEEDREFATLKQQSYLAIVALQGHRVGSTSSVQLPLPPQLAMMQHVVDLLVTGTPPGQTGAGKDSPAARLIALTGAAGEDHIL